MPSSLQLNGELFSSYKNHTTLKGLVGISPGGAVTFISQLVLSPIENFVRRSGFLDLPFDDKNSIMADKGSTRLRIFTYGTEGFHYIKWEL